MSAPAYVTNQHIYGTVNNGAATNPLTLTLPSAPTNGNVLFAAILHSENKTVSQPSGWTLLLTTATQNNRFITLHSKVAGASESASHSWTPGLTFWDAAGIMIEVSGAANPATYFDTPVVSKSLAADPPYLPSSTRLRCPTQTTTVADSLVLLIAGSFWDVNDLSEDTSVTPPSGYTQRGNGGHLHIADKSQASAGATGTNDWTAYGATWWGGAYTIWGITCNLQPPASGAVGNAYHILQQQ